MNTTTSGDANEVRVLNLLMMSQSLLASFPTSEGLLAWVAQTLTEIPSVQSCAVCRPNQPSPIGDIFEAAEQLCLAMTGVSEDEAPSVQQPASDNLMVFPLRTGSLFFGYVLVVVVSRQPFECFHAAASNFINSAAMTLQGRLQKAEIDSHAQHLEELVRERTASLMQSEERLSRAMDGTSDGIWDWNAQTNEVFYSRRWKEMLGFDDDEIENDLSEWDRRIHPDDRAAAYEAVRKHFDGEETQYVSEHRLMRKDGTWAWVLDRGKVVSRTADGKPLRVVGAHSDITTLMQAQESLRESEERYRTVADYTYDWEYWWLSEGRFAYVSPSCERITGYSVAEFMENPTLLDAIIHPEDASIWEKHNLAESPEHHEVEFRIIRKDGMQRWIGHVCESVLSKDGTDLGRRGSNRDITELKRATEEKANLEERLFQAKKLEGIGRLAGGVAHEFNNLLTVINGYSHFLLDRLKTPDPCRSYAEAINSSGQQAANLTRQLLAFGRKQLIQPRALDLNTAVRGFALTFQPLLGKNIRVVTHLDGLVGAVMGDPEQVQHVMMNLVLNARDAMPDGGQLDIATANVELDNVGVAAIDPDAVSGSYVLLTVTDNGKGMDEATRQRVFEPFFTTKGMGEGTGLGLATVYGIIRQSNGWIDVSSEVGVGTSFRVYLPRIDGTSPSEAVGSGIDTARAKGKGQATILLVEDQGAVRAFTKAALERHGYAVIDASDGEQAIAVAKQHLGQIDLLVTDVVLPGMNGKAVSQRLKALQRNLKVLFISGYTADVFIERGELDVGAAFLQKPFSPDALAAKVREVLDTPTNPLN